MKAAVSSINVFKQWPFFFPLQITSTVKVLSCFLANSEFRRVSYYSLKKKSQQQSGGPGEDTLQAGEDQLMRNVGKS